MLHSPANLNGKVYNITGLSIPITVMIFKLVNLFYSPPTTNPANMHIGNTIMWNDKEYNE